MARTLTELEKQVQAEIARKVSDPIEAELLRNYRQALDEIRVLLGKLYEKYSTDGTLTLADMTRFDRLSKLEKQIADILGPVFSRGSSLVNKLASVEYEQAFYRYGWAVDQATEAGLSWGLISQDAIKAAVENPLRYLALDDLKRGGLNRIKRAITQGLIRGDSYPTMAREIKGAFDNTARDTLRIARTEGQRAQVEGQIASYEEAGEQGVEYTMVWDATLDNRTRPEHARLDGKEANEDGMFETSVGTIRGPTLSGVASFDINCRCRVTAKVKGFSPKLRRIRDEGVGEYKTFETWAKGNGLSRNVYKQAYSF